MNIRIAQPEDAAALLSIYAPYVEHTAITFEYEIPAVSEFESRIRHTLERYPYLVAEEDDALLGYAYVSPFHARAAYAWSVETSVYVREELGRKGIGRLLYQKLEALLGRQHICNLYACIAYPNPSSIAFHESLGYQTKAHFTASGFKLGAWHDIIWMEKALSPHKTPPDPFIPFPVLVSQPAESLFTL